MIIVAPGFKHWECICGIDHSGLYFYFQLCVWGWVVSWWWCNIPWHLLESCSGLAEDGQPILLEQFGEECRWRSKTNCWVFWFHGKTRHGIRSYSGDVEVSRVCYCFHRYAFIHSVSAEVMWTIKPPNNRPIVISRPVVPGPMAIALPLLCCPSRFSTFLARHCQLCQSSAGRWGPVIGWQWRLGLAGDCPSPLCTPAGDLTPVTPVKGTHSGEIKSLDQDLGIVSFDPGMRFPGNQHPYILHIKICSNIY